MQSALKKLFVEIWWLWGVSSESLEDSIKTFLGNQSIGVPECSGGKFSNAVVYANVENRKCI